VLGLGVKTGAATSQTLLRYAISACIGPGINAEANRSLWVDPGHDDPDAPLCSFVAPLGSRS
jgi:hypothetical protein